MNVVIPKGISGDKDRLKAWLDIAGALASLDRSLSKRNGKCPTCGKKLSSGKRKK